MRRQSVEDAMFRRMFTQCLTDYRTRIRYCCAHDMYFLVTMSMCVVCDRRASLQTHFTHRIVLADRLRELKALSREKRTARAQQQQQAAAELETYLSGNIEMLNVALDQQRGALHQEDVMEVLPREWLIVRNGHSLKSS